MGSEMCIRDRQVVAQGDVTYMGKVVESLVMEFDQAKYEEFLFFGSKSPRARQYRKVFSEIRTQGPFGDFSEYGLCREHHCWPYHT